MIGMIKLARRHERQWAQIVKQTDATFQEVFSQASSTNSIKLLSWCISSTVPLCYMSGVLATAMQQNEDIPATTTAAKPDGSLAPGPSSSPAHPPGTPPLPVHSLLDILFVGTPPVGHPFAEFLAIPKQKRWDCSSKSSLDDHCNKRTHADSQEVEARSEHRSAQGNEDMPKLVLEAGPSFKQQQGQEPTSSPCSLTRATADPDDGTVAGIMWSTRYQASSDSELSREDEADSDMDTASEDCVTCSDTDEATVQTTWKKYWKRVWASCRVSKGSL